MGTRFEFLGELIGRLPGANQIDHLAAKLGRVGGSCSGHGWSLRQKLEGLHETGSTPLCALRLIPFELYRYTIDQRTTKPPRPIYGPRAVRYKAAPWQSLHHCPTLLDWKRVGCWWRHTALPVWRTAPAPCCRGRCCPGVSRLDANRSRIFQVLSRNPDRYPAMASGNPTSASCNPRYGDRNPGIDGLYPIIPAGDPGTNTRIPRKSAVEWGKIVEKGSFSRIIPYYKASRSLLSGLKFPVPTGAFCLNDAEIDLSFQSVRGKSGEESGPSAWRKARHCLYLPKTGK